jgi:hypothetical protein
MTEVAQTDFAGQIRLFDNLWKYYPTVDSSQVQASIAHSTFWILQRETAQSNQKWPWFWLIFFNCHLRWFVNTRSKILIRCLPWGTKSVQHRCPESANVNLQENYFIVDLKKSSQPFPQRETAGEDNWKDLLVESNKKSYQSWKL